MYRRVRRLRTFGNVDVERASGVEGFVRWTMVAIALLASAGCNSANDGGHSDGGSGGDAATADLAGADLRHAPLPDGASQGTNGCNSLAACEFNCNDNACVAACEAMATQNAIDLFNTADQCRTDWCLGTGGVGTSHCVLDAMMNPVDPTGAAAGTCDNCLNDAAAMLSPPPSMCITPGGPDCNPQPCAQAQAACLADKP
jgi:hypothetical protein